MARPIVGVICNHYMINDEYPSHASGVINGEAISQVAQCLPMLIPADPRQVSVQELQACCDGFLFTGGRPNIHPDEYGHAETPAHGSFDRARDALVLPLIRACIASGQPIFGICRGFQEVAVAMGSTLHPEIRDLPGRMNHRMPPEGSLDEKFAHRHSVKLTSNGPFHRLLGAREVLTNTLHGQGIDQAGPRVVIDGIATDGTPEALYIKDAPGFTLSVQWHPEWQAAQDDVSRPLFQAFGQAVYHWAGRSLQVERAG